MLQLTLHENNIFLEYKLFCPHRATLAVVTLIMIYVKITFFWETVHIKDFFLEHNIFFVHTELLWRL